MWASSSLNNFSHKKDFFLCEVSPAHLTNCAFGETVNQSSIKYPKSCIVAAHSCNQQHLNPPTVDELDIEGPASLCVIFHRWNFTNMLISHSAFFSHAKRFHFFSSSLSFTFFSRMPITPCPLYSGRYACAQLLTTRTVQVRLLCLSHANTMSAAGSTCD